MPATGAHRTATRFGPTEIAPPHDYSFQLRHYVMAPEVREGSKLVQIIRLASGALVKADVTSSGTVEAPSLDVAISSAVALSAADLDEVRSLLGWHLWLDEDLRPFYALAEGDPVLSASIEHNYGGKAKSSFSMFDAVMDVICAQNTAFRRMYTMRTNLALAFGDPFVTPGRVYHASPTAEQLASAPLEAIRACGAGYRDRYIKGVAEAVVAGFDLEALRHVPREEAREELMRLPGVGPYTADLALIIGARRQDALFLDSFLREALSVFYFGGDAVSDETLLAFAADRWGPYRGLAWLYLSTNTEVWARTLGIRFRLKSGALSDPDPTDL